MADSGDLETVLVETLTRAKLEHEQVEGNTDAWATTITRLASSNYLDFMSQVIRETQPERYRAELRLKNYRELADRVADVFGDELRASRWLSSATEDFEGKTPLEVAEEHDYRVSVLEPVLNRIEHGIDA